MTETYWQLNKLLFKTAFLLMNKAYSFAKKAFSCDMIIKE